MCEVTPGFFRQVRPSLQNMLVGALSDGQQGLPAGSNMQEILSKMMSEVAHVQGRLTSAPGRPLQADGIKDVLHNKSSCQLCKDFLATNNVADVNKHPAFCAFYSKTRAAFCQCPRNKDDWDPSSTCDFHDGTHTVRDTVWGFAKLMEQEAAIDEAVPAIGAACMALASKLAECHDAAAKGDSQDSNTKLKAQD